MCLVSARSDGPDHADSLSTTYVSRVNHSSHAACSGGTYIWTAHSCPECREQRSERCGVECSGGAVSTPLMPRIRHETRMEGNTARCEARSYATQPNEWNQGNAVVERQQPVEGQTAVMERQQPVEANNNSRGREHPVWIGQHTVPHSQRTRKKKDAGSAWSLACGGGACTMTQAVRWSSTPTANGVPFRRMRQKKKKNPKQQHTICSDVVAAKCTTTAFYDHGCGGGTL